MSHVVYKKSGFKFFSPTKNRCENHIHKSWVLGIQKPLYNVCFSETDGDIKIIPWIWIQNSIQMVLNIQNFKFKILPRDANSHLKYQK